MEQYFEYKDEFNKDQKAKEQLIRDRQTHLIYGNSDDESEDSADWESDSQSGNGNYAEVEEEYTNQQPQKPQQTMQTSKEEMFEMGKQRKDYLSNNSAPSSRSQRSASNDGSALSSLRS